MRQTQDPKTFPGFEPRRGEDALGGGEYVVEQPGETPIGHFGLAVKNYTHSTAPNRRFADLVTHRLVKAAMAGDVAPYSVDELQELATHITQRENDANKVERQFRKSAAALSVVPPYRGALRGAGDRADRDGVYVRALDPPVDGRPGLRRGRGLDVGDHVNVKLVAVDVTRGYVDFARTISWQTHRMANRRFQQATA